MIPVTSLNRIDYSYMMSNGMRCNISFEDKHIVGDVTG